MCTHSRKEFSAEEVERRLLLRLLLSWLLLLLHHHLRLLLVGSEGIEIEVLRLIVLRHWLLLLHHWLLCRLLLRHIKVKGCTSLLLLLLRLSEILRLLLRVELAKHIVLSWLLLRRLVCLSHSPENVVQIKVVRHCLVLLLGRLVIEDVHEVDLLGGWLLLRWVLGLIRAEIIETKLVIVGLLLFAADGAKVGLADEVHEVDVVVRFYFFLLAGF